MWKVVLILGSGDGPQSAPLIERVEMLAHQACIKRLAHRRECGKADKTATNLPVGFHASATGGLVE